MSDWISVEDRLPDGKQLVFCWGAYKDNDPYPFICWFYEEKFMYQVGNLGFKVTHWMPINPPKEQE